MVGVLYAVAAGADLGPLDQRVHGLQPLRPLERRRPPHLVLACPLPMAATGGSWRSGPAKRRSAPGAYAPVSAARFPLGRALPKGPSLLLQLDGVSPYGLFVSLEPGLGEAGCHVNPNPLRNPSPQAVPFPDRHFKIRDEQYPGPLSVFLDRMEP